MSDITKKFSRLSSSWSDDYQFNFEYSPHTFIPQPSKHFFDSPSTTPLSPGQTSKLCFRPLDLPAKRSLPIRSRHTLSGELSVHVINLQTLLIAWPKKNLLTPKTFARGKARKMMFGELISDVCEAMFTCVWREL